VNKEVVVIDFVRTALVQPLTSFINLTSQDLAAACISDLIKRTGLPKDTVQDVVFGQSIITTFPYNLARHATLLAELPVTVPGGTVQCLEMSGLQALQNAYHLAVTENSEIVIAGGAESYSAAPYVIREARYNYDPKINIAMDTITEVELYSQPSPLEKSSLTNSLADSYGYTPEQQSTVATQSFEKALTAKQQNFWTKHITPISIKNRKKGDFSQIADSYPESGKPCLTDYYGPCTADGACAMLIMSAEKAGQYNLPPIATIKGAAFAACAPKDRWKGVLLSIEKLLAKKSLTFTDIDIFEIREDSAAAMLAITETLSQKAGIPLAAIAKKINPHGGSLGLGSCAGADGMILSCSLILELQKSGKKRGIVAASAAGGQGLAILIEL
jgi:acetyl-CoA C-acetyltransferase